MARRSATLEQVEKLEKDLARYVGIEDDLKRVRREREEARLELVSLKAQLKVIVELLMNAVE